MTSWFSTILSKCEDKTSSLYVNNTFFELVASTASAYNIYTNMTSKINSMNFQNASCGKYCPHWEAHSGFWVSLWLTMSISLFPVSNFTWTSFYIRQCKITCICSKHNNTYNHIHLYWHSFCFENSNMLPYRSILFQICIAWKMTQSMRNKQQIKNRKETNSSNSQF